MLKDEVSDMSDLHAVLDSNSITVYMFAAQPQKWQKRQLLCYHMDQLPTLWMDYRCGRQDTDIYWNGVGVHNLYALVVFCFILYINCYPIILKA